MDINEIFAKLGELLSYEQYSQVDSICDRLISTGHNEKEIYLVKLLAEAEVKDINDLADSKTPLDKLPSYDFIIREFDKDMADYVFECNEYIYSMQKYNASKASAADESTDRDIKNDAATELIREENPVKKGSPAEDRYAEEEPEDNYSDNDQYYEPEAEEDVRQYAPRRSSYTEDNYYNDSYSSEEQYEDDEYEDSRRRSKKKKSKFAAAFDDEEEYSDSYSDRNSYRNNYEDNYEDDNYEDDDDDYDDEEVTADMIMLIIAIILGVIDIGSFVFTLVSGAI